MDVRLQYAFAGLLESARREIAWWLIVFEQDRRFTWDGGFVRAGQTSAALLCH